MSEELQKWIKLTDESGRTRGKKTPPPTIFSCSPSDIYFFLHTPQTCSTTQRMIATPCKKFNPDITYARQSSVRRWPRTISTMSSVASSPTLAERDQRPRRALHPSLPISVGRCKHLGIVIIQKLVPTASRSTLEPSTATIYKGTSARVSTWHEGGRYTGSSSLANKGPVRAYGSYRRHLRLCQTP